MNNDFKAIYRILEMQRQINDGHIALLRSFEFRLKRVESIVEDHSDVIYGADSPSGLGIDNTSTNFGDSKRFKV